MSHAAAHIYLNVWKEKALPDQGVLVLWVFLIWLLILTLFYFILLLIWLLIDTTFNFSIFYEVLLRSVSIFLGLRHILTRNSALCIMANARFGSNISKTKHDMEKLFRVFVYPLNLHISSWISSRGFHILLKFLVISFGSNMALFLGVGRSNCDTISLGQGQGPIATKMIAKVIIILKIIISLYIYKQLWLTLFTSLLTNSQL